MVLRWAEWHKTLVAAAQIPFAETACELLDDAL